MNLDADMSWVDDLKALGVVEGVELECAFPDSTSLTILRFTHNGLVEYRCNGKSGDGRINNRSFKTVMRWLDDGRLSRGPVEIRDLEAVWS